MLTTGSDFRLEVDRGPNWLFVRVEPTSTDCELKTLADELWEVAARHFIYRLVVELDAVDQLPQTVVEQLLKLRDRLEAAGGAMRICGLSAPCADSIEHYKLPGSLPNHTSRVSAVLANDSSLRLAAMHFDPTVPTLPKPAIMPVEPTPAADPHPVGGPHIKPQEAADRELTSAAVQR